MPSGAHQIRVCIFNHTNTNLGFSGGWFDSGGPAPGHDIPKAIPAGKQIGPFYFEHPPGSSGCSGYVVYRSQEQPNVLIAFAFSNPVFGTNKLGTGCCDPHNVKMEAWNIWDGMSNHDYKAFTVNLWCLDKGLAECRCSAGNINQCDIELYGTLKES